MVSRRYFLLVGEDNCWKWMPSFSVASTKRPGVADVCDCEAALSSAPKESGDANSRIKVRHTRWGRLTMKAESRRLQFSLTIVTSFSSQQKIGPLSQAARWEA